MRIITIARAVLRGIGRDYLPKIVLVSGLAAYAVYQVFTASFELTRLWAPVLFLAITLPALAHYLWISYRYGADEDE